MEKKKTIHIGMQIVPMAGRATAFPLIDEVIEMIGRHGFRYSVTPFETVVECSFEEALQLLAASHDLMNRKFQGDYLINARFHIHGQDAVVWEDKVK